MWFVLIIIGSMLLADIWWWWYTDRLARGTSSPIAWRIVVGITSGIGILGLLLLLLARIIRFEGMIMPEECVKGVYVWHFMVLPVVLIVSLSERIWTSVKWVVSRLLKSKADRPQELPVQPEAPTEQFVQRRAFLAQAVMVLPPVVATSLTARAIVEDDDFRINRIDLPLPNLPPELEGTTIAHVADPHIGSFMSDAKYRAIIQRTNELDADLVLHAGDLINHSLKDLPDGIQMLRQMRGRYGVFGCQGNHDCIDRREEFESATRSAEVGMLLDEARTVRIKNQKVQILSPRWVARGEAVVDWSVGKVLAFRDPSAFAIVLAHHPHAFDAAAANNVPLTLSGHTHGGQFRLFGDLGIGALMYKYWSGVYRQGESATVVSNGIGNWFPLRVNVPCEIIHLTLRRM